VPSGEGLRRTIDWFARELDVRAADGAITT
jgi:hypothetical protein